MCMIRNGKTNAVTSLHGSATAFSVMHIYLYQWGQNTF